MALIRVLPAGFQFRETDEGSGQYLLTFTDNVIQEANGGARMIPTGLVVEVGPIASDDVREMCSKVLGQLSPLEVPRPTVLRPR